MKSTGIIKHIDFLGRFKIPKELVKFYNINPGDKLQINKNGRMLILKKEEEYNCIFCYSSKNIQDFKNKKICKNCIKKIKTMI